MHLVRNINLLNLLPLFDSIHYRIISPPSSWGRGPAKRVHKWQTLLILGVAKPSGGVGAGRPHNLIRHKILFINLVTIVLELSEIFIG